MGSGVDTVYDLQWGESECVVVTLVCGLFLQSVGCVCVCVCVCVVRKSVDHELFTIR